MMKKHIIGIDAHMIGDRSGGNESYYRNILLNMSIPDGIKVILFAKPEAEMDEFTSKFEIVRFKSRNAMERIFIEIPKLCQKYHIEVLHMQYFIPFIQSCPIVCTIHDICFEHYNDIFTKTDYIRQKILIPYAAKKSCKVFTVSEHAKKDIISHYGIAEKNVVVTYDAVSDEFHKLADTELSENALREKFGIGNQKYILSVCNLQPRKNLIRLVKAFNSMKRRYGGAEKLVIVGKKAWMYTDILKTALEESPDIVFTDYVNQTDLVRLYNAATGFVYPSFFEGFGIPPLEAMACGTPVAVANATSLPEVAGDAAIYFDPYNIDEIMQALHSLLTDEKLTDKLVEMGKQQAQKFSWSESAKGIMDTYLEILGKGYENR